MDDNGAVLVVDSLPADFEGFLPLSEGTELSARLAWNPSSWILHTEEGEKEGGVKEIVVAALLVSQDFTQVFRHTRGSTVFQGLLSLLVTGHVDVSDAGDPCKDAILTCLLRELREEVGIEVPTEHIQLLGFLNTNKSEISKLHLGVLFLVSVDPSKIVADGIEVLDGEMVPISSALPEGSTTSDWDRIAYPVLLASQLEKLQSKKARVL